MNPLKNDDCKDVLLATILLLDMLRLMDHVRSMCRMHDDCMLLIVVDCSESWQRVNPLKNHMPRMETRHIVATILLLYTIVNNPKISCDFMSILVQCVSIAVVLE